MIIINIEQFFKENHSLALGFSGGVDSSYLLYAGLTNNANIKAYYVKSDFQPEFELQDALEVAKLVGAKITILELNVLENTNVISNPPDRCYHCKIEIFKALQKQAVDEGFSLIIDGTNASDDASDRPGMRALAELSVRSPLRECGMTKEIIRQLSKEAGLPTWDKPAYSCLATRIPTGRSITKDLLYRVEQAENALFTLGFTDFRVRVYHDAARLQLPVDQLSEAIGKRAEIIQAIKPYFPEVLLDLEGR